MGCYVDTVDDDLIFYPADPVDTADECTEACSQAGYMFSAYESAGQTTNDMSIEFEENGGESYVKVDKSLGNAQELTVCMYVKVKSGSSKYYVL